LIKGYSFNEKSHTSYKAQKISQGKNSSIFSDVNSIDNWRTQFFSLVLAQSNTVGLAMPENKKLVSTTATYEDSGNPNVKINATSNDLSNEDLMINYNDFLFENELSETNIFLIDLDWEILLESDFSI
jgi:hypothetical protein